MKRLEDSYSEYAQYLRQTFYSAEEDRKHVEGSKALYDVYRKNEEVVVNAVFGAHQIADMHDSSTIKLYLDHWNKISQKVMAGAKDLGSTTHAIIFSRHPVDVMRMSDHPEASIGSCHGPQGNYFICAMDEAAAQGVLAYLVSSDDFEKIDLDSNEIFKDRDRGIEGISPIARIRLRVFRDVDENISFIAPEKRTYPRAYPNFLEEVTKWAWQNQQSLFKERLPNDNALELVGGNYRDTDDHVILNDFFKKSELFEDFGEYYINEHPISSYEQVARVEEDGDVYIRRDHYRGDIEFFKNNALHREDGPACEYADGEKRWYINDKLHREDGPAVAYADGTKEWWLWGAPMPKNRYLIRLKGIANGRTIDDPQLQESAKRRGIVITLFKG